MNDEDVVKKSALLVFGDDYPNKLLEATKRELDFTSTPPERIGLAEKPENSLITNGNNADDGLNDVLWPPFC